MADQTKEQKERDDRLRKVTERLVEKNEAILLQSMTLTENINKANDEREKNRII